MRTQQNQLAAYTRLHFHQMEDGNLHGANKPYDMVCLDSQRRYRDRVYCLLNGSEHTAMKIPCARIADISWSNLAVLLRLRVLKELKHFFRKLIRTSVNKVLPRFLLRVVLICSLFDRSLQNLVDSSAIGVVVFVGFECARTGSDIRSRHMCKVGSLDKGKFQFVS